MFGIEVSFVNLPFKNVSENEKFRVTGWLLFVRVIFLFRKRIFTTTKG
jgi:hypothetical protein